MSQAIQETTPQASALDITPALDIISKNAAEGRKNRVIPARINRCDTRYRFFPFSLAKNMAVWKSYPKSFQISIGHC